MNEKLIQILESDAIELFKARAHSLGMTTREVGMLAFPDDGDPKVRVQNAFYNKSKNNKPLRVRLGDFCGMCLALKLDPVEELEKLLAAVDPNFR